MGHLNTICSYLLFIALPVTDSMLCPSFISASYQEPNLGQLITCPHAYHPFQQAYLLIGVVPETVA